MAHMTDTTDTPEILRQAPAGRVVLWTGEVATLAGVTPMTVTRWTRAGKVEASTTAGGNRRYWPPDVVKLLHELGREVPPWLAGVAEALRDTRPLGLADLDQLAADLSMVEDWLTQDAPGADPAELASIVRRARVVVEGVAAQGAGS